MTTETADETEINLDEVKKPEGADDAAKVVSVTDDELLALKAKVEESERGRLEAERRAQDAESSRDQAQANRYTEAARRVAAQESSVTNAIAAKTAQIEQWKTQIAELWQEGKFHEAADLSVKAGAAQSQIDQLAGVKEQLATERTRIEEAAKNPPQDRGDPLDHLPPKAREWARKHPEFFQNGQPNRKAVAAHHAALAEDIEQGSTAYFEFLDRHLGLVKPEAGDDGAQRQQQAKPTPSAAPVSRSVPERQQSNNRTIRLSREQQEAARLSWPKLSAEEAYKQYAKNLDDLRREGRISA